MKKIAIIPARAGSKGLKNKNIIDINGKPLITYTIEAAQKSNLFDKIIVTTDSIEYAKIASRYRVEIIIRDSELAKDDSSTYVVLEDVINKYKDFEFDYFVLLQPTSPLRNYKNIIEAIELFEEKINEYNFLVSVCISDKPRILINELDEMNSLSNFKFDFKNYGRQKFNEYYPNGAIFIGKPIEYINEKSFFGEKSIAYKMKKVNSVDIDDWIDLELAKVLLIKENKYLVGGNYND